jgi:hypothetical protein
MFVEANSNDLYTELVANHAKEQILPDLVKNLLLIVLFWVFELDDQGAAMLPGLPCGLTVLLKDHYLRIDLVLRGKFDRGVV